jgi:hypothetical protein
MMFATDAERATRTIRETMLRVAILTRLRSAAMLPSGR